MTGKQVHMVQRHGGSLLGMILMVCSVAMATPPDEDVFFKINKSIDVFGRVYREITTNYVDDVDPEKFMMAGIDGMLETLDPYTVYIGEQEGDEVDLLTNGKYGGIGVTIGFREGSVRVISVMDGHAAQRAGIQVGDRFLEIGGARVDAKKTDEVRALMRGEPGTEVKILVERDGDPKPLEFVLIREEIKVRNVTYAGFVAPGIGYVRLERFSRQAGDEVRQAVKELKLGDKLDGLILDLRGNPGGLLDAAVEVVSKFVPKGSLVVSTHGRRPEADKKYYSSEDALLPATPMVVLTDRSSASASEIVAGGLQDLDRALVVGTRTFGKGLVQTILPLNYGAQLKITTARYYTPSGRCIQEIDYLHKDRDGVFIVTPDSLKKEFKTAHGRVVLEHGGVTPDSVVAEVDPGPMIRDLNRKSMFFKFMNTYLAQHRQDSLSRVTDEMVDAFRAFLAEGKFDFSEETEGKLKDVRTLAQSLHYGSDVLDDLNRLQSAVEKEKSRAFDRYRDHIVDGLTMELMGRLKGEHGRIEASFHDDAQLNMAVGLLTSPKVYQKKIGG
jgi:carboxyl-terminal processing protease